jgi:hypothetical protein
MGFPPAPTEQQTDVSQESQDSSCDYVAEWPAKGGVDGPQPWDLAARDITVAPDPASGVVRVVDGAGQVTDLAPGAPDSVSPIVPAHGRPPLTSLSVGDGVRELGMLLAELGYDNSVSRGQNPFAVFDESIAAAVDAFRRDYDVEEDPSQFPRDSRANAQSHVLAWTWEGLLRAVKRHREGKGEDGRQLSFAG